MIRGNNTVTTDNGPRPAGPSHRCFYCDKELGLCHAHDCVIPTRTVMVRAVIEYPIEVPESWAKEKIEFHRNLGSWCSGNIVEELRALSECLCPITAFAYVREATEQDHKTAGFTWRQDV